MSRPKNTKKEEVVEVVNEVISQDNTNEKDLKIKQLENENKKLQNDMEEIKNLLKNFMAQNTQNVQSDQIKENKVEKIIEDDNEVTEINPNKYIKVISLNFGKLVLTTEEFGKGKKFEFHKFGDVRNVMYTDLSNIYHVQQSFAEQGRFFICDKVFLKNHGLTEYYNKFLTKEKIEKILDYNSKEIVDVFKNTTDAQKEIIINILIKKIIDGEDVDISKVDVISRLYGGENIFDIARARIAQKNKENENEKE